MASIVEMKRCNDHFEIALKVSHKEFAALKGKMDNIYLIPIEKANTKSKVYERGKNTKYLLIPKSLRKGITLNKKASCLRSNYKGKIIFAYFMDKVVNK